MHCYVCKWVIVNITTVVIFYFLGKVEVGDAFADPNEVEVVIRSLKNMDPPTELDLTTSYSDLGRFVLGEQAGGTTSADTVYPLYPQWRNMVVRNMSCRAYPFPANIFIAQKLTDFSAAEHNLLSMLALDGKRTVYPRLAHSDGFAQSEEIVAFVCEIAELVSQA